MTYDADAEMLARRCTSLAGTCARHFLRRCRRCRVPSRAFVGSPFRARCVQVRGGCGTSTGLPWQSITSDGIQGRIYVRTDKLLAVGMTAALGVGGAPGCGGGHFHRANILPPTRINHSIDAKSINTRHRLDTRPAPILTPQAMPIPLKVANLAISRARIRIKAAPVKTAVPTKVGRTSTANPAAIHTIP